jgi:serine/threonine protein kinase
MVSLGRSAIQSTNDIPQVLFDAQGCVKLADFGLSRILDGSQMCALDPLTVYATELDNVESNHSGEVDDGGVCFMARSTYTSQIGLSDSQPCSEMEQPLSKDIPLR